MPRDKRMAAFSKNQRARLGQLWEQKRRTEKKMKNAGHSFVKILEHVAKNEK